MLKWKADAITGFILLAFSVASLFYTFQMDVGSVTHIQSATPGYYVRIWVVVLGVLSIFLLISAYRRRKSEDRYPIIWYRNGIITTISLGLYLFLMPYLGFIISTTIFLFVLFFNYSEQMKKFDDPKMKLKAIILNAVISIVVTFVCSGLFGRVLGVIMPEFSLF